MSKKRHLGFKITLGVLVGLLVASAAALEFFPSSRKARELIQRIASGYIDGKLDYSALDVSLLKEFPLLRVTIDSLSVSYPHERFAMMDGGAGRYPLLDEGRGEVADTLLHLDRLTIGAKPWRIFAGRVFIRDASVSGLRVYVHQYDSTRGNWNIFIPQEKPGKDSSSTSLPLIVLKEFSLPGNPHIVYTNQRQGIFASLDVDTLKLSAGLRKKENSIVLRRSKLVFDADLDARTSRWGRLIIPLHICFRGGAELEEGLKDFKIDVLDCNLAHVPLHVDGKAHVYKDSTVMDAALLVRDCPLDTLLAEYGSKFFKEARDFGTNASVTLDIKSSGVLSDESFPRTDACLKINPSWIYYHPMHYRGDLAADIDALLSPSGKLDLEIDEFDYRLPGLSLSLDGNLSNILKADSHMDVRAEMGASLDSLMRWIPADLGIEASGSLNASARASTFMSKLSEYNFEKSVIQLNVRGENVNVSMPQSDLAVNTFSPRISAVSNKYGISLDVNADSLYFHKGDDLAAKARAMSNHGMLTFVKTRFGYAPRVEFDNREGALFLRSGANRYILQDLLLGATVQKRVLPKISEERRKAIIDSVRKNSPRFDTDDVSRESDFKFNVDSASRAYLRQWNPTAKIAVGRGFVRTPSLPLRTRINGFEGYFDGDTLAIDSLIVVAGTSDIRARGSIAGLRRNLQRGGRLNMQLALNSNRINVNELLSALQAGKEISKDTTVTQSESYVIDTLADSDFTEKKMTGILLPSNVDASLKVAAGEVNYTDINIRPFLADICLKDRTLQILGSRLSTDLGSMSLSAYYSTSSVDNIEAGVDLSLSKVQADGILRLMPSFENMMPALKSFKGNLDFNLSATAGIDSMMNVIVPSMDGIISIEGKNLMVEDAGSLRRITRLLRFRNKDIGAIQDLSVNAVIHDGKLEIFPFEFGVDRYKLALYGMHGMDNSMYYHASILKSPFLLKFGINIFGTNDDLKFRLCLPKYHEGEVPQYSSQVEVIRFNIAKSIKQVLTRGVENVNRYNHQMVQSVRNVQESLGEDSLESRLSAATMQFEYDAILQEEDLQKEVDDALEASYKDIETMMDDYAKEVYDKNILKRLSNIVKKKK